MDGRVIFASPSSRVQDRYRAAVGVSTGPNCGKPSEGNLEFPAFYPERTAVPTQGISVDG
jgi:hypothetical protein